MMPTAPPLQSDQAAVVEAVYFHTGRGWMAGVRISRLCPGGPGSEPPDNGELGDCEGPFVDRDYAWLVARELGARMEYIVGCLTTAPVTLRPAAEITG